MYKGKDILGKVFGHLTVVGEADTHPSYGRKWLVRCTCGKTKVVQGSSLRAGTSTSCGRCSMLVHGMSKTPTYTTWKSMLERCTDPRNKSYFRYGGKGIGVCERWLVFANFFEDMGVRPEGKTLDRKDSSQGYDPDNCRWATPKEQALNTSTVKLIEFGGEVDSVKGWAEKLGISPGSMAKRLSKWSVEKSLTEPRNDNKCN